MKIYQLNKSNRIVYFHYTIFLLIISIIAINDNKFEVCYEQKINLIIIGFFLQKTKFNLINCKLIFKMPLFYFKKF